MKSKGVFLKMYLYHNTENDLVINVEQIQARRQIVNQLKNRFSTYGYNEIYTPTFENYDLYANMNGTINQQQMIKTIDNTGKVLVLRPDITIPITEKIAKHNKVLNSDLRYSYVQDVFRQTTESQETRESTQAGVEYFGSTAPEADAEIIALAIHLLQDVHAENIKIELGHAGFFKQLANELQLDREDFLQLKQYIQAKNITEIEFLLNQLHVDEQLQTIIKSLPFLYGNPLVVFEEAKQLPLSEGLLAALENLNDIYDVLVSYDVADHLVIDLSLINHMDYYSDMIFQGFIQKVGKPILMGGRYNRLADQFGADIPAIGFACDIDLLLTGIPLPNQAKVNPVEITIFYDKAAQGASLQLANHLRNCQYNVLTYAETVNKEEIPHSVYTIQMKQDKYALTFNEATVSFETDEEVLTLLEQFRERE